MKKSELFTQDNNGLNKPYSHATMKDARKYISEHSIYGIRGYLFNELKDSGSVIWFTKPDYEAEYKYPDSVTCNV